MRIAIINDNVVNEIKDISDDLYPMYAALNQAVVDITDILPQPQVGWTLQGSSLISNGNNVWLITCLAMRNRFSMSELRAIYTAAKSVVDFQILLDNLANATYIDLKRADTIASMGSLVGAGVLSSDRRDIILNTPPTPSEAYKG